MEVTCDLALFIEIPLMHVYGCPRKTPSVFKEEYSKMRGWGFRPRLFSIVGEST